jgi:type I restriction enzyme R subunit
VSYVLEPAVEEECLGYLRDLGYQTLDASELAPDAPAQERSDYTAVVLRDRLEGAVARLNLHLPTDALDQAVRELTTVQAPALTSENKRLHELITEGVPVEYRARDGSVRSDRVRVVEFDNPDANDWLVTHPLRVE